MQRLIIFLSIVLIFVFFGWQTDVDAINNQFPPTIVTTTADSGPGSLREIIANAPPGALISFDNALEGQTITLPKRPIKINKNLTIVGLGADKLTISGAKQNKLFIIKRDIEVSIGRLALRNGGRVDRGGAIFNSGILRLTECLISNNMAEFALSAGGAIFNKGSILISDCVITDNSAIGADARGGAIFNDGSLLISGSTLARNRVEGGGAEGGGIFNAGGMDIIECSFFDNIALGGAAQGGAIFNLEQMIVNNTTISGNSCMGGSPRGGGIANRGILDISSCTIFKNMLDGADERGWAIFNGTAKIKIKNTIIVGEGVESGADDLRGEFTSLGHNLINNTQGNTGFGVSGDIIGQDPLLKALADNGGLTLTHALLNGSPAIDNGNNDGVGSRDQRGLQRIFNDRVDIGAYELQLSEMKKLKN